MRILKQIIENNETRSGRYFDFFIQALIVLSLATFAIETLPHLSSRQESILQGIEVLTITIFTIEYVARVLVADSKPKFIFSFYGIIDLVAILPFYIALGADFKSIRVIRLFRLFRTFKLIRYSKAVQRLHRALQIAKEEIILYLLVTLILLYFASVGIYYFENKAQPEVFSSVFHSLWWSVATLTTVGYGDIYPVTVGGRVFTFFMLIIGLGVVSVPAGLVASALSKARELEDD